ncbi:MAG TPA: hypothetical protein HPP56_01540 [Nitrospirae bacterium]|nr:hypothetical protein [Nitrospirota bacterium]
MKRREFLKISAATMLGLVMDGIFDRSIASTSMPDRKNNLLIKDKSITIYTELNYKNVQKKNPHWGIVSRSGKLQDKAILKAYVDAITFHDALTGIGAKPGNNLTEDNIGVSVKGDLLNVTAYWEASRPYHLKEILEDTSGRGFKIRFGGNREMALKEKTGCIMCLESCWIGITSNDIYPNISNFKRMLSPNSQFKGNEAVLPKIDGHPVIVKFELVAVQ